jgi:hypothetical protein
MTYLAVHSDRSASLPTLNDHYLIAGSAMGSVVRRVLETRDQILKDTALSFWSEVMCVSILETKGVTVESRITEEHYKLLHSLMQASEALDPVRLPPSEDD